MSRGQQLESRRPGITASLADVLRAFALLGILVVNMWDFAYTGSFQPPHERWPAWWDQAADWVVTALFAGKFNSLFSFLFGVGFYLQLQRLFGPMEWLWRSATYGAVRTARPQAVAAPAID